MKRINTIKFYLIALLCLVGVMNANADVVSDNEVTIQVHKLENAGVTIGTSSESAHPSEWISKDSYITENNPLKVNLDHGQFKRSDHNNTTVLAFVIISRQTENIKITAPAGYIIDKFEVTAAASGQQVNVAGNKASSNGEQVTYMSTVNAPEANFTVESASGSPTVWFDNFEVVLKKQAYIATVNAVAHIGGNASVVGNATQVATANGSNKDFNFSLKATPANERYEFRNWTDENGDVVSEDAECTIGITCTPSNAEVSKTYYANFEKVDVEYAMDVKMIKTGEHHDITYTPAFVQTSTKPTDRFIIVGSSNNQGMRQHRYGPNISLTTAGNANNASCYTGTVDTSDTPTAYNFDGNKIWYMENGITYYLSQGTGTTSTKYLATVTDPNKALEFTIEQTDNAWRISYIDTSSSNRRYYLQRSGTNAFNVTRSATPTVRLFEYNTEAIIASDSLVEEFEPASPLEFSIKADYATLYCPQAYKMPKGKDGNDINGYFITGAETTGELSIGNIRYKSDDIVPAGTSLLLTGSVGNYDAIIYEPSNAGSEKAKLYADTEQNQLLGSRDASGYTYYDGNVYYYKLAWNNSHTKLGFWWGDPDGGPFKLTNDYNAFLVINKEEAQAHGFNLPSLEELEDGETNAIQAVEEEITHNNDATYTVSGIRVNDSANLPAGIYIRNGKKFIVR